MLSLHDQVTIDDLKDYLLDELIRDLKCDKLNFICFFYLKKKILNFVFTSE